MNIVETYLELSDTDQQEFLQIVQREELAEVRRMMTIYEQRGMLEGQRRSLLRAVRLKFGEPPEAVEARIRALGTEAELDACLDRVMLASTLQETGLLESSA